MKTSHSDRRYQWEHWENDSRSSETIDDHVETVYMVKQLQCKQCDFLAKERGTLAKHMKIQHPCEECKQTSTTPASFKDAQENKPCEHWKYSIVYTGSCSLSNIINR